MTTAPKNREQLITAVQNLAVEADWRYFSFYLGHVQTLGRESAGEMIRRVKAADEDAARVSYDDAVQMRETYLNLILPALPSDFEGERAILHTYQALKFCPKITK